MANFIPKFEFNEQEVIGNVLINTNTITSVNNTLSLIEGMIIVSNLFPDKTTVLSFTSDEIVVSNNAMGTGANENIFLTEVVEFVYPSTKQAEEKKLPNQVISDSISGMRQVQTNNVIGEIDLEFKFLTKQEKEHLENRFYMSWALYGYEFKYYESKDELYYKTMELGKFDFIPVRAFPKQGDFLYNVTITLRRVIL